MKVPIAVYKNQEQLNTSLKEWQTRLGLNEWCITAELDDMDDDECAGGDCIHLAVERVAAIRIHIGDCSMTLRGKIVRKAPQELTLVHELLHCKFGVLDNQFNNYDAQIVYWREHCLIEDVAKALIMAKYNITLDWFKLK